MFTKMNLRAQIDLSQKKPQKSQSTFFWLRKWSVISAAGAVLMSLLDAFLLQQKYSFFTGGFLSRVHTKGPIDILGFMFSSLLSDAALIGFLVALGLWLSSFTPLKGRARSLMALSISVVPFFIADFFFYKLARYLGDILNFKTMFELTGKSFLEVLAVGFPQLISSALLVLGLVLILVLGLWILNRFQANTPETSPESSLRAIFVRSIMLFFMGLLITTFVRIQSDVLDQGLRRKPTGRFMGSLVALISDFDRDGYGLLRLPSDPDPFAPEIFPYALEIPGNGIDENGVGGDLPKEVARYSENMAPLKTWKFKPDIVFIMLESFRADIIGADLKGKAVTPVLNLLATKGVSAKKAYSHNGYTVQSRHHVFSGSLANLKKNSLIDDFKQNGYQVAYFSGQDESFGGPEMGIGFERADIAYDARADPSLRFTRFSTPGSIGLPFQYLQDKVTAFLDSRTSPKPLFLYVNFIDTHFPYYHDQVQSIVSERVLKRSEIAPDRSEALQAMYLNTAANIDRAIGEVIKKVRQIRDEEPAVIVTSDHGESLFDEGFLGHGYVLNEVQTRIPLIVSGLPMRIKEPFGQSSFRDSIREALARPETGHPFPKLETDPRGRVFQYTGNLRRPAQIAFTRIDGQITYRFRAGRVKIDSGGWKKPEALDSAAHEKYLELVHFWESMILAQERSKSELPTNALK